MAKKDNIDPEEAKKIVQKFCEPPYNAEEIRLKEDVRLILKGEGKSYESEDDEEKDDGPQAKSNSNKSGGSEAAT